jgi:hypothetical protein
MNFVFSRVDQSLIVKLLEISVSSLTPKCVGQPL